MRRYASQLPVIGLSFAKGELDVEVIVTTPVAEMLRPVGAHVPSMV